MNSVLLEIVAPMLSTVEWSCRPCRFMFDSLGLRQNYHSSAIKEYPEEWKQAVDFLAAWIQELSKLYRHRIKIRVIDAQSPVGLWKQIRYRLFRFPAFIVDRKHTYIGWNAQELEALIDDRIRCLA